MVIANNGCKMKDFVNNVVTEKITLIKVIKTSVYHQKGVYLPIIEQSAPILQLFHGFLGGVIALLTCSLIENLFLFFCFFEMKKVSFIIYIN